MTSGLQSPQDLITTVKPHNRNKMVSSPQDARLDTLRFGFNNEERKMSFADRKFERMIECINFQEKPLEL